MSIPSAVFISKLHPAAQLPSQAHPGDAGWDLCSVMDVVLNPGQRCVIPTGIAIAMPGHLVGLVHARSGRARREGLALVNAPGVIDAGYRGEVAIIAINLDPEKSIEILAGERIAQLVFQEIPRVSFVEVEALPGSGRGVGGFGSSGQ